jgi:NitT/TauT family transport system substrate-binding protein
MIAGTANLDAAMTYEPFLSAVRAKPEAGKIIATTLDYPMVMDTFGCTPKFLADNAGAAQGAGQRLFRRAGHDQGRPEEELRDHGRRRQADRRAFEKSQAYLRWQDREANQKFFAGEFTRPSARRRPICCWRSASSSQIPDLTKLADTRFIK